MLLTLFFAAPSATNVESTFMSYAYGYCSGGVANADIGEGNLVNRRRFQEDQLLTSDENMAAYNKGAAHAKMAKEGVMAMGFQPGAHADPEPHSDNEGLLGDCNEKDGNTCQDSGGLYHWCNYSQYKCMAKYSGQQGAVSYYNMNKAPAAPETYSLDYDNDYDKSTTSTMTKSLSTQSTQTLTVTDSITIGASLQISAGVPDIIDTQETFSWSVNMESSDTSSKVTTDSFSWSGIIPEDAMSTTTVLFTIEKTSYSGAWNADIGLPYYAKLWCNDHTNGHYEWFIPADGFMPGSAPYQASGVFTGGAGVSMHAVVKKCELFQPTNCPSVYPSDESDSLEEELPAPQVE